MPEEDRRHIENPKWLVYGQIERILRERAEGMGAFEGLYGLLGLLSPYRKSDPDYQAALADLLESMKHASNPEKHFYDWFDAAIDLVARQGWWLIDEEAK